MRTDICKSKNPGSRASSGARRASSPARSSVCLGDKAALQYLNILSQRGPASTLKRGGNTPPPRWLVEHLVAYVDSLNFPPFFFFKNYSIWKLRRGRVASQETCSHSPGPPSSSLLPRQVPKDKCPPRPIHVIETIKTSPHRTGLELKLHKTSILSNPRTLKDLTFICVGFDMLHGKRSRVVPSQGDVWAVSRTVMSTGGPDQRHY